MHVECQILIRNLQRCSSIDSLVEIAITDESFLLDYATYVNSSHMFYVGSQVTFNPGV